MIFAIFRRTEHWVYGSAILSRPESLLAILANIDIAHANNLLIIECCQMDDASKEKWFPISGECIAGGAHYALETEMSRERIEAALR